MSLGSSVGAVYHPCLAPGLFIAESRQAVPPPLHSFCLCVSLLSVCLFFLQFPSSCSHIRVIFHNPHHRLGSTTSYQLGCNCRPHSGPHSNYISIPSHPDKRLTKAWFENGLAGSHQVCRCRFGEQGPVTSIAEVAQCHCFCGKSFFTLVYERLVQQLQAPNVWRSRASKLLLCCRLTVTPRINTRQTMTV